MWERCALESIDKRDVEEIEKYDVNGTKMDNLFGDGFAGKVGDLAFKIQIRSHKLIS